MPRGPVAITSAAAAKARPSAAIADLINHIDIVSNRTMLYR